MLYAMIFALPAMLGTQCSYIYVLRMEACTLPHKLLKVGKLQLMRLQLDPKEIVVLTQGGIRLEVE